MIMKRKKRLNSKDKLLPINKNALFTDKMQFYKKRNTKHSKENTKHLKVK
jgi:hypothetical protein